MTEYPLPVHTLIKTLDELFRHLGKEDVADLIRQAEATIDFTGSDNWDGGTDFYTLSLHVPIASFAAIDSTRENIEHLILEKTKLAGRKFSGSIITQVLIVPDAELTRGTSSGLLSPTILQRIWEGQGLRLFLTHRAQDKLVATTLKKQLVTYGVFAFVAHEDIEPNQQWQGEIERALASMHGLAALLLPGIETSVWCQQEIGFALGSGIPIFPLRLGADPSGFIGQIQALSGNQARISELAGRLVDLLIMNAHTASVMRKSILNSFERVWSWENAKLLSAKIVTIPSFDEEQLVQLDNTTKRNVKVKEAWGVPEAIRQLIAQQRKE